jgi:hypothetical protein
MNIVNSISKSFRDATKGTMKVYYDLRRAPYVTCPRCSTNIAVDLTHPPTDIKEKKEIEVVGEPETQSNIHSLPCTACGMTLNYVLPTDIPTATTASTTSQPQTSSQSVETGSSSKST